MRDPFFVMGARGALATALEAARVLPPPRAHVRLDWDRVEGMLLGLAIGDALGNTTESMAPAARRAACGEVRDYRPNHHAANQPVGLPSDDTQLAFWTLEHLLEVGHLDPERLARLFASRPIFGLGGIVRAFLREMHGGASWGEAGQPSAGNGAIMRIAPVVVAQLAAPSSALWIDAAVAGAITHNDPTSIAACVALVGLLWELLALPEPPRPEWWLDTFIERARPLEGDVALEARPGARPYRGPAWRHVDTEVRRALAAGVPTVAACDSWYSGAFLLETIPSVLYIVARHGHDPEEALVRAVNDTCDNDTVAAIVGALVGALHGAARLPRRWRAGLLGRTGADDDGRVFELIDAARRFAPT
ncbi:MAG TPA: ADP-ribosylglycohydrolase family protein [Polyangia bacterium]|jgi:ADP-ribosylglycohydrolase